MPDMKRFRIPDSLRPRMRSANAPYAAGPRKRRLRGPDLDRLRDREWPRPHRPRWLHGPDIDAMRDREWRRPRWLALPGLAWLRVPEMDVPARLLVPGIAVILLLFGGGLYFGNVLGSDPSAASLITTLTRKGSVTIETVRGKRVKVTIPAKTITRKKTVHGHRSTLTQTDTQTLFHTHTQIVPVPTTIVRTSTVTKTVPTTVTVTVTQTVPST
jgi:hypothetical protein